MSAPEIRPDQYWIDKRLQHRHRVWDLVDGRVEMNGPTGACYSLTPEELRSGYELAEAQTGGAA